VLIYTTEHITCISFINDVLLIMLIIVVAIIRIFSYGAEGYISFSHFADTSISTVL